MIVQLVDVAFRNREMFGQYRADRADRLDKAVGQPVVAGMGGKLPHHAVPYVLADASVDAGMLANCVFATVIWPYRWFHAGSKDTPESIADTCTAFVSRGVKGGFALS